MSIIWSLFLYLSAGLFWVVVSMSVFQIIRRAVGTNEKVRTAETVVTVLRKVK